MTRPSRGIHHWPTDTLSHQRPRPHRGRPVAHTSLTAELKGTDVNDAGHPNHPLSSPREESRAWTVQTATSGHDTDPYHAATRRRRRTG
jgi:hypothetical protein